MLMQTLVALCAWMLADREPSPEDIAMHKTLLAEVAATGSLTFANKSDLVVVAKGVDGELLLDATVSRINSGRGNFLVEGKRAKLALDMRAGRVYIAMRECRFYHNGKLVRETGPDEDDGLQVVVYLMDIVPARKGQR